MQQDANICLQVLYASKYLYIWLHIATYTHISTILAPKRYATPIHSILTARKLVHATLVWCSANSISLQRAVAPTELPRHLDNKLRQVLYK